MKQRLIVHCILMLVLPATVQAYLPGIEDLSRVWDTAATDRKPVQLSYSEVVTDGTSRIWEFVLLENYWSLDYFAAGSTVPERTYRNGKVSRRVSSDGKEVLVRQSFLSFDEVLFTSNFAALAAKLESAGLRWQSVTLEVSIEDRSTAVFYGLLTDTAQLKVDRRTLRPELLRQPYPKEPSGIVYHFEYDRTDRYPRRIEITMGDQQHILKLTDGPDLVPASKLLQYRYRRADRSR